jgi:hypothetical protein
MAVIYITLGAIACLIVAFFLRSLIGLTKTPGEFDKMEEVFKEDRKQGRDKARTALREEIRQESQKHRKRLVSSMTRKGKKRLYCKKCSAQTDHDYTSLSDEVEDMKLDIPDYKFDVPDLKLDIAELGIWECTKCGALRVEE